MIKEELYVIIGGTRHQLDLVSPSGITLIFKSNIFADLSKIDCSKSYTFQLPDTNNNMRIFDLIGDVRVASSIYGIRLQCEYWQDGVQLVSDGHLYVADINNGRYNAVMSFDVIDGLVNINRNDKSIRKIGSVEFTQYGYDTIEDGVAYWDKTNYDNSEVQHPYYVAGIPYKKWKVKDIEKDGYRIIYRQYPFPPPVVPVYKIVQAIASEYSINFDPAFMPAFTYNQWELEAQEMGKLGGVPLVSTSMSKSTLEQESIEFRNPRGVYDIAYSFPKQSGSSFDGYVNRVATNVLQFGTSVRPTNPKFFTIKEGAVRDDAAFVMLTKNVAISIDGYLKISFNEHRTNVNSENIPTLEFYYCNADGFTKLTSIESVKDELNSTDTNYIYEFDFRESEGKSRIEIDEEIPLDAVVFIRLSHASVDSFDAGEIHIYPKVEEGIGVHECEVFGNLPDISCMEFLKSMYYVCGGFPKVTSNGIGICYYTDLRTNIANGVAYDWSGYLYFKEGAPETVKFTNGNLAIKNYYLMKNESLDSKEEELADDVYGGNKYSISCDNKVLESSKTIIQYPYYGKYMLNGKHKSIGTGESIKYWSVEDNIASAAEAKPAIGFFGKNASNLTFRVWQMQDNAQYEYLQSILQKPIVIKLPMACPLIDLVGIDYTIPVYLEQFNAYFAIISITLTSSGKCEAELIKLPNN